MGINETFGGFGINEKTKSGNIYYYKQEVKTNEQIRVDYFKKIETCTKQKSKPIPIPKRNNF